MPNSVHSAAEGISALGSSARNATPEGSDSTPAPITLFAKLNVDVAIVALPPVLMVSCSALIVAACKGIDRRPSIVDLFSTKLLDFANEPGDANEDTETQLDTIKRASTLIFILCNI